MRTRLYEDGAYEMVAFVRVCRTSGASCLCGKKTFLVKPLIHPTGPKERGYIIRNVNGEVIVERDFPLKRTLSAVVKILEKNVSDDEEFWAMPRWQYSSSRTLQRLNFMTALKKSAGLCKGNSNSEFIYEKPTEKHILSHPLTLRKLKHWLEHFGEDIGQPLDPFQTEQRRLLLASLLDRHEWLYGQIKDYSPWTSMDEAKKHILTFAQRTYSYKIPDVGATPMYLVHFSRALFLADEEPLEQDLMEYVNDLEVVDENFWTSPWKKEEKEVLVREAEELFASSEWKEWKELLAAVKESPMMTSPLLCAGNGLKYWTELAFRQ